MSIYIIIGRDHGWGAFRASIKLKENFTSGRNITIISRLSHANCNKDNGEILGNTGMSPIWYSLKNIFSEHFLVGHMKENTQFRTLLHGCPLTPPRV